MTMPSPPWSSSPSRNRFVSHSLKDVEANLNLRNGSRCLTSLWLGQSTDWPWSTGSLLWWAAWRPRSSSPAWSSSTAATTRTSLTSGSGGWCHRYWSNLLYFYDKFCFPPRRSQFRDMTLLWRTSLLVKLTRLWSVRSLERIVHYYYSPNIVQNTCKQSKSR